MKEFLAEALRGLATVVAILLILLAIRLFLVEAGESGYPVGAGYWAQYDREVSE